MATRKTVSKSAAKPAPARAAKPAASEPPQAAARPRPAQRTAAPTGAERYRWIAHAAYLKAERRGFVPGQEVEDWLAAEAEFLAAFGLKHD